MDNNQDYQQQPDYQQPVEQPVEQPQYQEPQYQQPYQQQPQYQQPYQQQPEQPESFMQNSVVSLVLAIITTLSCLCNFISGIIGIGALVLAILAMVKKNSGEIQKSRDFAKYSIITSIVGLVLGIIIVIVMFVIYGGALLSRGAFNDMF